MWQSLLQIFIKMKKKFSLKWKESKQPRKQRKYRANAPLNVKRKFITCNLSKELRKKYSRRNVPVRKGDTIIILRGKLKKKKGKVLKVFLKLSKVVVEGIQVKKQDGSKVDIKLQPSNLQIIDLNMDDKKRLRLMNRNIENKKDSKKEDKKEKSENAQKKK